MIDINTRCIRIHGYTPAEIFLGYNLTSSRQPVLPWQDKPDVEADANNTKWTHERDIPTADEDTIQAYIDCRDERASAKNQTCILDI